jgi:hypothetical protein
MTLPLDSLQRDRIILTGILEARRGVSTETLSIGMRLLWGIYLNILEDALSTLNSLIQYLTRDPE